MMILIAIALAVCSGFLFGISYVSFVCIGPVSARIFIVAMLMAYAIGFGSWALKLIIE
jgi:hypothetical protein